LELETDETSPQRLGFVTVGRQRRRAESVIWYSGGQRSVPTQALQKLFPFEPSHCAHDGLESYPDCRECFAGKSLAYFKTLQTLFGTRAHAFGLWAVSTRDRRLRIVNCGDFCGHLLYILMHLATFPINLPQLLKRLNLRRLQGFWLPFNELATFRRKSADF
jgi:hypothetical protein